MSKISKARELYSFRSVWTSDGKIIFKDVKNLSGKENQVLFFLQGLWDYYGPTLLWASVY